ncbi:unnamed protein product [Rhizophagus irregularis]|nr:unnamed protein product [Rhizophagus irregularis]
MFQVTFTCSTSDTGNVKSFDKCYINGLFAPKKISKHALLKHHIGLAGPQRLYSLLSDDDKIERIYPQALVKQFQFPEHPQYDEFDIFIRFNSRMDFYFTDDTTPIGPLQYDF